MKTGPLAYRLRNCLDRKPEFPDALPEGKAVLNKRKGNILDSGSKSVRFEVPATVVWTKEPKRAQW
jgi:hypothetical protein